MLISRGLAFDLDDFSDEATSIPNPESFPDMELPYGDGPRIFVQWAQTHGFDVSKMREDIPRFGSIVNIQANTLQLTVKKRKIKIPSELSIIAKSGKNPKSTLGDN